MSDNVLFNNIAKTLPTFNDDVCAGLATKHLRNVGSYVHQIWECVNPDFPPELKYHGYALCTPEEEFQRTTKKRGPMRTFETTITDTRMARFNFTLNDRPIEPVYLNIPYVRPGGLIKILGSTFSISPILSDKSLSVTPTDIFTIVNRAKVTFKRMHHDMLKDGVMTKSYVLWGDIYNRSKRNMSMRSTLAHYLFCKFGVKETFRRYTGADVIVGEEIDPTICPPDTWHICSSASIKPRGLKTKLYNPSPLKIAVRKKQYGPTVESLIASLFYIVDHFPTMIDPRDVDDPTIWKVTLGYIILDSNSGEGKLLNGIDIHLRSLDGYIDIMGKGNFAKDNIFVDNLYDLFYYIITHMPTLIAGAGNNVASIYDKRFAIIRYVCQDISNEINRFMFDINKRKNKNPDKLLTEKEVNELLAERMRPDLINKINRDHGEISSVSNPSGNMAIKVTLRSVPQAKTAGGGGRKAAKMVVDESTVLHASIAEVGSLNYLLKNEPTGRSIINPYVHTTPEGSIVRDPAKRELMDHFQSQIQR